jgi:hypothetical protein
LLQGFEQRGGEGAFFERLVFGGVVHKVSPGGADCVLDCALGMSVAAFLAMPLRPGRFVQACDRRESRTVFISFYAVGGKVGGAGFWGRFGRAGLPIMGRVFVCLSGSQRWVTA